MLLDLGLTGRGGLQTRLDSFYESLQAWCRTHGESLHMVRLTSDLLGISSRADFPQGHLATMNSCSCFGIYMS